LVDWTIATLSVVNFLLTAGALFFAIKASRAFGRSSAGKAWRYFVAAAAISSAIALVALGAALESLHLPTWWREGGSMLFRVALLYAVYYFYKAWTRLGQ